MLIIIGIYVQQKIYTQKDFGIERERDIRLWQQFGHAIYELTCLLEKRY